MTRSLLGFDDNIEIGATAPRRPLARGTAPAAGRKPVSKPGKPTAIKAPAKGGRSPHKAVLLSATAAAHKAIDVATRIEKLDGKYATQVKGKKRAPVVPLAVKGRTTRGTVVLGATVALTPKQSAAVKRHAQAIGRTASARKKAKIAASAAKKVGKNTLDFVSKTAGLFKKRLETPGGGGRVTVAGVTEILGNEEILGSNFEILGCMQALGCCMIGVDANGLFPGDPGYDPASDPDAFGDESGGDAGSGAGGGGLDTSSGIVTASDGSVLYDPNQDPLIVPPPLRNQPVDLSKMTTAFQSPPDNCIWYPYDTNPYNPHGGSILSANKALGGDGFEFNAQKNWFDAYRGGKSNHDEGAGGSMDNKEGTGGDVAVNKLSMQYGWGPLIGRPGTQFEGLQMAANGQWFALPDNARDWMTKDVDAKIAIANQNTIKANTAAALAQLAAMQLEAAAQAEAQAKLDAELAMNEQRAQSEAAIAQTKQDTQAAQQDIDAQRGWDAVDQQQAQADIEAAKQQAKLDADAQHALIEQTEIWNQWARANPEAAMAQLQQQGAAQGEGDGEGGGGEASYEDAGTGDVDYSDPDAAEAAFPAYDDGAAADDEGA